MSENHNCIGKLSFNQVNEAIYQEVKETKFFYDIKFKNFNKGFEGKYIKGNTCIIFSFLRKDYFKKIIYEIHFGANWRDVYMIINKDKIDNWKNTSIISLRSTKNDNNKISNIEINQEDDIKKAVKYIKDKINLLGSNFIREYNSYNIIKEDFYMFSEKSTNLVLKKSDVTKVAICFLIIDHKLNEIKNIIDHHKSFINEAEMKFYQKDINNFITSNNINII